MAITWLREVWDRFQSFLASLGRLRGKFLIAFFIIGFVPLAMFTVSTTKSISTYLTEEKEITLKRQANRLSTSIAKSEYIEDKVKQTMLDEEVDVASQTYGNRIMVLDDAARVLSDSSRTELNNTIITPEILAALNNEDTAILQDEDSAIHVAVSIVSKDNDVIGAILLIDSAEEILGTLEDIEKNMLYTMIPMSIAILIVVFFISHLLIEPMNRLLEAVSKMSEGHLDQQVEIRGNDEFTELGESFNEMSTKLEQVETARQEFVSNVSHELKTPLSSMKVLSEALLLQDDVPVEFYVEFLNDINSEIDRMTQIVNELLTLVKIDQTETSLETKPVEVSKLMEDILKRLYPLAEQRDIELLFETVRDTTIEIDEMKLSLAISNLVENGIKYTESGGTVKVTIDADHQNAFITVQDTGIGIDEEDIDHVFTRFYRVDKTRDRETGGTGLGLAITHKTVLLHNGSIRVTSEPDEGSTFFVRLPIHQPEQTK